jgi:hypothetical protein
MKNAHLKNLLFIDIETASSEENFTALSTPLQQHWERKASFFRNEEDIPVDQLYDEKAAIYAEFGKVIVISMGFFLLNKNKELSLRVTSLANHNEKELLSQFKSIIETKFDQDELLYCAHNGKEFDYPYLCRRLLINNLSIPSSLNMMGKKPWETQHLDTMEMWKFGDRKNYTSLDLLAGLFDIPSSKTGLDGSQVNHVYYNEENGLDRIAEYCRGDVIVTAQLYLRMHNLPLILPENITNVF